MFSHRCDMNHAHVQKKKNTKRISAGEMTRYVSVMSLKDKCQLCCSLDGLSAESLLCLSQLNDTF